MNSQEKLEIPAEIRVYLDNLMLEGGIIPNDPQIHEEVIMDLYIRLDNFIVAVIINHIPDDDLQQFIKLNEENRPKEEVEKFLKEKIPEFQEVFSQAFEEFRQLYLNSITSAKNSPM